jgi:hypothetical protein
MAPLASPQWLQVQGDCCCWSVATCLAFPGTSLVGAVVAPGLVLSSLKSWYPSPSGHLPLVTCLYHRGTEPPPRAPTAHPPYSPQVTLLEPSMVRQVSAETYDGKYHQLCIR